MHLTLLKKSQGKLLGPDFGDIKWSTASIRSRVGQLNALAFLDDLWAKTFSTTSLVRAASRLFSMLGCNLCEYRGMRRDKSRRGTHECVRYDTPRLAKFSSSAGIFGFPCRILGHRSGRR